MMRETWSSLANVCEPETDFVQHLGILVYTLFQKTSDKRDLDEAISLMLSTLPGTVDECDAAAQLSALEVLVRALLKRHKLNADIDPGEPSQDLDDALRFSRLWLLMPQSDSIRFDFTMRTSEVCFTAFNHYNDSSFLDEALQHLRKLDETQVNLDCEEQSVYLMSFSDLLWQRFENGSDLKDLNESIKRGKDAVAKNPNGVPHLFFHYLALRLVTRYKSQKSKTDLEESIGFDIRAIELTPKNDPALANYFLQLGLRYQMKYEITKDMEDLERAITTNRSALIVTPQGHMRRPESLNNLGLLIFYRFERQNLEEDLNETLDLLQEAVATSAVESTGWRRRLANLIVRIVPLLSRQAAESRTRLAFSIDFQQLEAAMHSNAAMASNACAVASLLKDRLSLNNNSRALQVVISLAREGLRATKEDDPEIASRKFLLGQLLTQKAERTLELDDIEDAIRHWRDAEQIANPPDHFVPEILYWLSKVLLLKHTKRDDKDCSVLFESLQKASSSWLFASPENPRRTHYRVFLQHFPKIKLSDIDSVPTGGKHACSNCEELRKFEFPAENNPSLKKLAYDESSGKIITVPFDPSDLVRLPRELQSAALASYFQSEKSTTRLQSPSLPDFREAKANGVQLIDASFLKDKAPLPDQAEVYFEKYSKSSSMPDLECAISIQKLVVKFTKPDNPKLRTYQSNLAGWLYKRYEVQKTPQDLDDAIILGEKSVEDELQSHADRIAFFSNLATFYNSRWEESGSSSDLDQAISRCERILELWSNDDIIYSQHCTKLVYCLYQRFRLLRNRKDLDLVIKLLAQLSEKVHTEEKISCLSSLSGRHIERYHFFGSATDIEDAIRTSQRAIESAKEHSLSHPMASFDLANALSTKFESFGDVMDLDTAISLAREALKVSSSANSASRPSWLSSLGTWLAIRGFLLCNIQDSNDAVALCREAVSLGASGETSLRFLLDNLSHSLNLRFQERGDVQDLNNAIDVARRALVVKVSGSRRDLANVDIIPDCLDELGTCYFSRFQALGARQDLDESINLGLKSYEINKKFLYPGHVRRRQALNNLSNRFGLRFQTYHDPKDLGVAIGYARLAMEDQPSLETNPFCVETSFALWALEAGRILGEQSYLQEALTLLESQLQGVPQSNRMGRIQILKYMGHIYSARAGINETPSKLTDLESAISCASKALNETPKRTGSRCELLLLLGSMLKKKHRVMKDQSDGSLIDQAIVYFVEASRCIGAPLLFRIKAGTSAARCHADRNRWETSAKFFAEMLGLLPRVAPQSIERDDQQILLKQFGGFPSSAAAVALRAGQSAYDTLCLLEEGRGVIASLLIKAHRDVPGLESSHGDLYTRYKALQVQCNQTLGGAAILTTQYSSLSMVPLRSISEQITRRQEELEELILVEGMIREIPGFENFQHPFSLEKISQLASSGPLVSFNVSPWGSDAIYVTTSGEIASIPLPNLKMKDLQEKVQQLIGKNKVFAGPPSARAERNTRLCDILEWLWYTAVKPVLQALNLLVVRDIDSSERLPRIFWVANGLMGAVPLHAAGNFRGNGESTSKYVVSTYVPTLKSLAFAREIALRNQRLPQQKLLVVNAPEVQGMRPLNTEKEIKALKNTATSLGQLPFKVLENPTKEVLLEQVKRHSIIHFACHGTSCPDNPSDSGLYIAEGTVESRLEVVHNENTGLEIEEVKTYDLPMLKVRDITELSHEKARLAYLSACSTAENSAQALVDEVIYVASAFQLAGFPHVIGTMWEAEDNAAIAIAARFYENLFQSSSTDEAWEDAEVAYALHKAVEALKSNGFPNTKRKRNLYCDPIAWAAFIHVGI
jgi:CHAT domain-containing protein/tetratricopeptide (TPR) repeat protein